MQWNIAIYGAGWVHNMGNSFIQIGSKLALERALPGANVHIIDGNDFSPPLPTGELALSKLGTTLSLPILKRPAVSRSESARRTQVKLGELAKIDALILSGVWLTPKYLRSHMPYFRRMREMGVPLVISGGSGTRYDDRELEEGRALLRELDPFALITRDETAFEAYKTTCRRVHSGIDAGFFIGEAFPRPLPLRRPLTVCCFDRGPIPAELDVPKDAVITHHTLAAMRFSAFTQRTFYSELAEDYLNLYAGSDTVYSDRVHACVAALSFGNGARLMDETPRAHLFDRVGAGDVRRAVVRLDKELLERRKQEHVDLLQDVFAELEKAKA